MNKRPMPRWEPDETEDAAAVADRLKDYTNASRSFVVYKYGTGVISDSRYPRSDADCAATLTSAVDSSPDFVVVPISDGNFITRFRNTVCGIVLRDHYERHRSEIEVLASTQGLLPGESLVAPANDAVGKEHYYVGIYARAKLYRDARAPSIVHRFVSTGQ